MYYFALKMLTHDTAKYFGLIFTIAIATFLMAQQLSIFIAAMNRTGSQITDVREANIWVMDPQVNYFEEITPLRDIDLYRIRDVRGVQWAVPFMKGFAIIRAQGQALHQAFLFGVDDATLIGKPKMLLGSWLNLKERNSFIVDKAGWRLIFGNLPYQLGQQVQINDRTMRIVGIADPDAPFFSFPLLYTRYSTALQLVPHGRLSMSFVLVKSVDQANPAEVAKQITHDTGLQALTTNQFKWRGIEFVLLHTPIPVNFALTISLGFLIGVVVVGQTFYLFLLENLQQFGLLKAVGMTNNQILSMVMLQAIWIALIGFGIGIGACALFSEITAAIFIDLRGVFVPWQVIVGTGVCVVLIILLASVIGVRKVFLLDPAIVFKG